MSKTSRVSTKASSVLSRQGACDQSDTQNNVAGRVVAWIAADDRRTILQHRWQESESSLFRKARLLGISCSDATESVLPQVSDMQVLSAEIEQADEWLAAAAAEIRQLVSASANDAIAKIELGLMLQGPCEWTDHARELLEDGLSELRAGFDPEFKTWHSSIR